MSVTDIQKEKSLLSRLKNNIRTTIVGGKIEFVPRDKTRFVCKNCKIRTVISMHESGQRKAENKMDEVTCDGCGTIYKKEDN